MSLSLIDRGQIDLFDQRVAIKYMEAKQGDGRVTTKKCVCIRNLRRIEKGSYRFRFSPFRGLNVLNLT